GDRADLRRQDYRDIGGQFDRIVSIEMVEAVGEAYWPAFFDTLRARLRPGGIAVLQVIAIAAERFDSYRRAPDFIRRHAALGAGTAGADGARRARGAGGRDVRPQLRANPARVARPLSRGLSRTC